jgi:integrase
MARLPAGITEWTPHPVTDRPRYLVRWRAPDGKQRKAVFDRLSDAKQHLASVATAKHEGTYIDANLGRQTFESFANEWAAAQDTWKQNTREDWPYIRNRLRSIGDMPLASIDQLTLKKLRAELAAHYAPATVKLTMAYAGMILRAAHASRRIAHDPTAGLKHKRARADERGEQVRPEDVPTRAEALAILPSAPAPFRAAIALGLAGLRVGEVLGMTADRIMLDRRQVTVDRQMQRYGNRNVFTTPKGEKVRTIVMAPTIALELRRHLRDHAREGVLFRGVRTGEMMRRDQFYDSAWRPSLRAAGLAPDRFKFHALRHFCASMLLAEGAPITAVAGHLGDTVETVSRTYAHWLRDDRAVPADVLERVLAEPGAPSVRHEAANGGE